MPVENFLPTLQTNDTAEAIPLPLEPSGTSCVASLRKPKWRKAPLIRRAAAHCIDRLLPVPFLAWIFPPWIIVITGYYLLSDGLLDGRSLGKRLMGLATIKPATGQACTYGRSFARNMGWTIAHLCYTSVLLFPIGLCYDLIELLLVLFSPTGQRLGDLLADTQVTIT